MARPRFHALVTAPVAWAAVSRGGWPAAAGVVVGGLFIDLDHLVDLAWTRLTGERTRFFAPLHGWELSFLAALGARRAYRAARECGREPDSWAPRHGPLATVVGERYLALLAGLLAGAAAGSVVHLIHDVISNRPKHPGTYSLLFRAWGRFERHAVGWGEHPDFHGWSGRPWYLWF